jgi:hypothetical protein
MAIDHPTFEEWERVQRRAGRAVFRLMGSTCCEPGPVPRHFAAQQPLRFASLWLPRNTLVHQIAIGRVQWLLGTVPCEVLLAASGPFILLPGQELTITTTARALLGLSFDHQDRPWIAPNSRGGTA